jgi:hypothetical protein
VVSVFRDSLCFASAAPLATTAVTEPTKIIVAIRIEPSSRSAKPYLLQIMKIFGRANALPPGWSKSLAHSDFRPSLGGVSILPQFGLS